MTTQSLLIIILTAAALSTTAGTLLGVVTGFVMVLRASKEAGPPEQACDEIFKAAGYADIQIEEL